MSKNFFCTKSVYLGKEHYLLRYADEEKFGQEFEPYSIHMREEINGGAPFRSLRSKGLNLGRFLDYFQEGLKYIDPTKANVNTLYRDYHSYLTCGVYSNSSLVMKICELIPSPMVGTSSSRTYHACITPFLYDLEETHQKYKDYLENGLTIEQPETSLLLEKLMLITPHKTRIRSRERAERQKHITPLSATTNKSNNRTSFTSHIPKINTLEEPITENQFFPLESITALIHNASCYRNSCLYALIAATGLRDCEADQILWEDIDLTAREILAVKPEFRKNGSASYRGLTEVEKNKLEWKGRGTPLTMLLEPYGTLFFYYLELYHRHEYIPTCGHNFVFHNKHGRPLFLCDYSTVILHQFRTASFKTLIDQSLLAKRLGLHSLRHSYIFFLKNYLEHSKGQGLSDHELLMITGHKDIRSLQRYAKIDRELLWEKISYANNLRKHGNTKSSTEFQIQYLEERLEIFKSKLNTLQPTMAYS